eukprot:scaffold6128_cov147-Isochrysis_galbana.AAC.1
MTDPPIDDTEAREQDAPGTTDAKHRAPVHGHTGDRGRAFTQGTLRHTAPQTHACLPTSTGMHGISSMTLLAEF